MKHPPGTVIKKRSVKNGRDRLQLNIWLPVDLLGRKARSIWVDVSPRLDDQMIVKFAERKIQAEFDLLRQGEKPYKRVYEAKEADRGLFMWLLNRHEDSFQAVSRKTGRKLSLKSLKDNTSTLKAFALYWEDRCSGWRPGAKPMRPLRKHPEMLRDIVLRLVKAGRDPKPREFSIGDAETFKDWMLASDLAVMSCNSHLRRVAARFADLCRQRMGEEPLIYENPFKADACGRLPLRGSRKRIYTLAEEQKLFDALHGRKLLHDLPGWNSPIRVTDEEQHELAVACEICIRTGVRRISLYNDISLDKWDQIERILRVDDGEEGGRKGGRAVAIPTNDMLELWLMEIRNLPHGKFMLKPDHAQRILRATLNALGIDVAQPFHGFRHTIYSRLREIAGVTRAKDLLGHALQGVDKSYTHETEQRAEILRPYLAKVVFHKVK